MKFTANIVVCPCVDGGTTLYKGIHTGVCPLLLAHLAGS